MKPQPKTQAIQLVGAAAVGVACLLLVPPVRALDWDDGGDPDEDFSNALNWAGDVLPTATVDVRIGSYNASITQPGTTFKQMFLGDKFDGGAGSAVLTMAGGDVTAQNIRLGTDNAGGGTGGNGTFIFLGGSIVVNEADDAAQAVEIGRSVSGSGTMVMGDGTSSPALNYTNGRFEVGNHGSGPAVFTFKSGTVTGTDNLIVGQGNNGAGPATMTVGGFATPAVFATTTDMNFNNQDSTLTIRGGGTVDIDRDVQQNNRAGRTSVINLNAGGTLFIGRDLDDRAGNSALAVGGGTLVFEDTSPPATTNREREVENLAIANGSNLAFHLGATGANSIMPLSVAGGGTKSASVTGTVTIDLTPGNFDNSAAIDTWTAGSATWDTVNPNQGQWDLGVSPDRYAGGTAIKVIDSPSVNITTDGTTNVVAAKPAAWTVNRLGSTTGWEMVAVAGMAPVSPRSAAFANAAANVTVGASAGDDLTVGIGAANAAVLTITDVNSFAVNDDLAIGGLGGGTVNIGSLGGGAGGGMNVSVGDDIVFGNGFAQGGTLNLNEGTLTAGGDIVEGTDDPNVQDAAVNNAQLQINGGTLVVNGSQILVQRFAVGQEDGSNVSFTLVAGKTLVTSGTLAVGSGTNTGSGATGVFTLAAGATANVDSCYIGENGVSTGTVNIHGAFTSAGPVYAGGYETGNADAGTTGTIDVSATGSLTVTTSNVEIGRDGTGFLHIDGGSYTQMEGNLVIGQNGADPDDAVGTVTFTNGATVNIGDEPADDTNLNFNAGGGSVTQSGAATTVTARQNLNFTDQGDKPSSYTLAGGTLNVEVDVDARGGNQQDTLTVSGGTLNVGNSLVWNGGTHNLLHIIGGSAAIDIAGNALFHGTAILRCEFGNGGTISPLVVGGSVSLNNAALELTGSLPASGSHTLIDGSGATFYSGTFAGLPEGAYFSQGGKNFQITYAGGDGYDTVVTVVAGPVVTISPDSSGVVEGASAGFTVAANPPPTAGSITVNLAYGGTASDGSDFTGVASVSIANGSSTAHLGLPTMDDGLLEGAETIRVTIDSLSGVGALVGAAGSATLSLLDGNSAPVGGPALTQTAISTSNPAPLSDIIVSDEAGGVSRIAGAAVAPGYVYNGLRDVAEFGAGFSGDDDDSSFVLSPEPDPLAGFAVEVEFTPTASDVYVVGINNRTVWESGGRSNGCGIYLLNGVPHFVAKMNGGTADFPASSSDDDWSGNAVCWPLAAASLPANRRVQVALEFDLDSITWSLNGSTPATKTFINRGGRSNWVGTPSVDIGTKATDEGGLCDDSAQTLFYENNYSALANAPGGGAVSGCRFWNSTSGSIGNAVGSPETIAATLTIRDWAGTGGGLSTTGGGSFVNGVWSIGGDLATVNAALAAVEFTPGTADPAVIDVVIDDQTSAGTTSGAIIVASTAPATAYVDDSFTEAWGSAVTDGDLGSSGNQGALYGYSAFRTVGQAVAAAAAGTVIVNDGDYTSETVTMAGTTMLRLADTVGGVAIGSLATELTNSVDLQGNSLTLGNGSGDDTIGGPISGSGSITKVGSDRLILWGVCTYTGTTTVNDGFLRVGFNNALGVQAELAGDGPVLVNSPGALELNIDIDKTIHQTGAIGGDGHVYTMGDGTVVFDGAAANTFSGGFDLGDGGNSSWDGVDQGGKNGFVVVNRSDHLGTGTILSRGAQLQAGVAGIVIPNDIEITGGGLRCGGMIDFSFSGLIRPTGATNRGFGNYGLEGLDLTMTGDIDLYDGNMNAEGSNDRDNGTWTFTGDIYGTGNVLIQNTFDNGIVVFTGANTYSGTTTCDTGLALVNGSHLDAGSGIGNYTVNTGAILGGSAAIDSLLAVNDGGILSPGASIGTLSFDFGVTFADNSIFRIEIDSGGPTPAADLLDANWDVTIGTGATLEVADIAATPQALAPGTKLTIIDYTGNASVVTGEFSGLPDGAPLVVGVNRFTIDYNDDAFPGTVTLTANGPAGSAYQSWVAANYPGLTGGFGDDPDLDGVASGLEWYFFNSDPTAAQVHGSPIGLPVATGPGTCRFGHLRPVDRNGLTESYEWTTDLVTWRASGASDGGTTVTLTAGAAVPAAPGYESVTVTVTAAGTIPKRLFSRLQVNE